MGRPAKSVQSAAAAAPGSRSKSSRAAAAEAPPASQQHADAQPEIKREHDEAVKAEDVASPGAGAPGFSNLPPAERRTRKRKADAAVKTEEGTVKLEPNAVKTEPGAVKDELLSPLRPSPPAAAKVEGWAEEAAAAGAAAAAGKVDLGKAPTMAPLGPFPDFKRPLPEECQASAAYPLGLSQGWNRSDASSHCTFLSPVRTP